MTALRENPPGERMWRLMNQPTSSMAARLYFLLSLSVSLLYLVCQAVSTLPELCEESYPLDMIMFSCVAFSALELCARYTILLHPSAGLILIP